MIMHSQLDIGGVQREIGQHKIKRSMRLLRKDMVILYKGLPHPKKNVSMGTKCNKELTRAPMYGQALPFTSSLEEIWGLKWAL